MAKFKCKRCDEIFEIGKTVNYNRCKHYWYWLKDTRKMVIRCKCGTVNIQKL